MHGIKIKKINPGCIIFLAYHKTLNKSKNRKLKIAFNIENLKKKTCAGHENKCMKTMDERNTV